MKIDGVTIVGLMPMPDGALVPVVEVVNVGVAGISNGDLAHPTHVALLVRIVGADGAMGLKLDRSTTEYLIANLQQKVREVWGRAS